MHRRTIWAGVAAGSIAAVVVYRAVRHTVAEARRMEQEEALINEALDESFPASDPPAFTPTSGSRV